MKYRVQLSQRARKALLALPKRDRRYLGCRLVALGEDPRPRGAKALSGPLRGQYRLRAGDYRVVYAVEDEALVVFVVRIGRRASVYGEAAREA